MTNFLLFAILIVLVIGFGYLPLLVGGLVTLFIVWVLWVMATKPSQEERAEFETMLQKLRQEDKCREGATKRIDDQQETLEYRVRELVGELAKDEEDARLLVERVKGANLSCETLGGCERALQLATKLREMATEALAQFPKRMQR